ncbi:MAG TPA: hypothetical protein VG056_14760 [Pirellulales bacterium]|jgi:hypothetical protein|nr:hypothetical protein [Pirellulales bacterium]
MPDPFLLNSSLDRILRNSQQFADRASEVSKIIEHVDIHLRNMPGKIPVEIEEGGITLGVGRPFDWGIWFTDSESEYSNEFAQIPEELISAAIKRKIRAFPLVLKLLDEIEAEQERQLRAIGSAGDLLLERLKEGK